MVSAATVAPVSASISTPVRPTHLASQSTRIREVPSEDRRHRTLTFVRPTLDKRSIHIPWVSIYLSTDRQPQRAVGRPTDPPSEWHRGMRSGVFFAPKTPAISATLNTSPFWMALSETSLNASSPRSTSASALKEDATLKASRDCPFGPSRSTWPS